MTEPLLRLLAARGERLSVAALPWVAPVYRWMDGVHEVIELPFAHGGLQLKARWTLAKSLRGRFARAYICPNSIKSALLPWLAGIPERIGRQGEGRWGLLTQRLANPSRQSPRPPMVDFYAELALADPGPASAAAQGPAAHEVAAAAQCPRLHVPAEGVQAALQTHALSLGGYVVIVPGAEYGPAKRWPVAHWAALACLVTRPLVVLGSGKEADLGAQIAAQAYALDAALPVRNLAGRTSLNDALALIAGSAAVVSNDTGLMHVAAALGMPQVALFGSSSPQHTPPINPAAQVIWLKDDPLVQPPLDCAPCFKRVCPLGHNRCLQDLSPQRVARALVTLM